MDITKEDLATAIGDALKGTAGELIKAQIDAALKANAPAVKETFAPDPEEDKARKELDGKFKSFGEYLAAIVKIRRDAVPDNRLTYVSSKGEISKPVVNARGKATLVEGTDSAGGFLVPEVFNASLIEKGLETSIVRANGAFTVPMASDTLSYPCIVETTRTSTVKGGIVGYWQGEGATYQESEPVFGNIKLTAKKLIGFTKVSDELLADSAVSLDPFLRRSFSEAWSFFEDIAFLRGTGSGQPLGILNAPALIGVTRQDTNDTIFEDILNIYSRVEPSVRSRVVWLANHECLPKFLRLHAANTVANTYGAQLVFISNIKDTPQFQVFGRPLIFTEKMSAQGVVGDIGCFDLGSYIIGDRQGLTIDMSNQVYWGTGYIAFKFTERVDGQPMVASAVTPYKGTATLSPFVTLAETS
jgi:HK97 family phage major capsid protein